MKHLVLIDGHHLMYRAYWAIPRTMSTRSGEQTNAVFGFASMMLSIIGTEEPDALLICFDEGGETFRHQENETYKDGRAETPDDFYTQIPRIFEFVERSGFKSVSHPQFEADDFLATYARLGEKDDMRVTIVTGDRDALQIANDTIRVAIPHKGYREAEYLGPEEIIAKYGIRPDQVPAYKGLCGDSSDNLPGVHGIGPKTAAKLLQEFHSLDGIYENIGSIKGSARDKLEADKEQAYFCERMAQLVEDIEPPVALRDLSLENLPADTLLNFFQEVEFGMLKKRLMTLAQTQYGQGIFSLENVPESAVQKDEDDALRQLSLF